jgi:Pyrimidine dimer DNA glycosylase
MQTFLPYPSLGRSVECLDRRRLGKQRVECWQLLRSLLGGSQSGWANHPAQRMWRGSEDALGLYYSMCCVEWQHRGYQQNMWHPYVPNNDPQERLSVVTASQPYTGSKGWLPPRSWECIEDIRFPQWLGREDFHASHRSNLLRKDPEHYSQFGWTEPADLPYIWPEGLHK